MQSLTICSESHPETHKWSYDSILTTALKVKKLSSNKDKPRSRVLNVTSLALKNDKQTCSQAEYQLSTISDPLWKKICSEVGRTMGPFAVLKIGGCQLGDLSSRNSTLDLYCPTRGTMEFSQQYGFVILGAMQQYFPALKELSIKMALHPKQTSRRKNHAWI